MKDWVIPVGLFVANVGINLLLFSTFNDALSNIEHKMDEKSPQNISAKITNLSRENFKIESKVDELLQKVQQR